MADWRLVLYVWASVAAYAAVVMAKLAALIIFCDVPPGSELKWLLVSVAD